MSVLASPDGGVSGTEATMNRSMTLFPRVMTSFCFAFCLVLALSACPARAANDGPFSIEILVDGRPLAEYTARGTTYIEARHGKEYAVRLTNRTAGRVAVALAVDGLNSIDATTTTARDAKKWILGPHRSIVIEGWQTDSATARKFFFTTERDSYGAWLGKTDNLGVVAAAFFRERRPEPPPVPIDVPGSKRAAPSAGAAPESRASAEADRADEMAATGIGREVEHSVRRIRFDEEDTPASVVSLRYEYHDELVRLGVLPAVGDALARRERARGFEDGFFAPDPWKR